FAHVVDEQTVDVVHRESGFGQRLARRHCGHGHFAVVEHLAQRRLGHPGDVHVARAHCFNPSRAPPSSRTIDPLMYALSTMCSTSAAYSSGSPKRFGCGTLFSTPAMRV